MDKNESKLGWRWRILIAAAVALGLMFGPWAMFFNWHWLQPALFSAFVALAMSWLIRQSQEVPAPLKHGWNLVDALSEVLAAGPERLNFAAKIYGIFAAITVAWWLLIGLDALYNGRTAFSSFTVELEMVTKFVSALWVLAAFCLGCAITARVAGWDMNRCLRQQEGRLQSDFAAARGVWLREKQRMERATRNISQAIGMLLADKRSGDKAIGAARQLLEEAINLMTGQKPAEEIRREILRRLAAVNCPAECAEKIVEKVMEHTPRANTAEGKLGVWANILRKDPLAFVAQGRQADFCERAACVKLTPA